MCLLNVGEHLGLYVGEHFGLSVGEHLGLNVGEHLGFRITPAPYEKAQASDGICKRAAHPGSTLNQKNVVCKHLGLNVGEHLDRR